MSKSVHALALGTALVAGILSLPATAADGTRVAAIIKGLDNPFFQYMRQGIDDRAKELGVEVNVQAAAGMGDSTGQADRLSAVAMQDYGCYLVNPISVSNLVQALVPVAQKNAPIVNIDSVVDPAQAEAAGFKVNTYIGTDNVEAGRMAGEEMLRLLPDGGKVALIAGVVGDVGSNARIKGFQEAVEGKLEVVQLVSADWDREKALTAADTILRAHPDLAGFFAVMSAGSEAKVIGLDGITDALQSVADGQLTATVSQYPYVVGAMGLEACLAAASGHELPANVNAPVQLITKDNAETALNNFPRPAEDYPDPFRDMLPK
jgi:ribose transport system substrate-binding protein